MLFLRYMIRYNSNYIRFYVFCLLWTRSWGETDNLSKMKAFFALLLIAGAFAAKTTTQDQILALLQTGTKSRDAIDSVFELLNDLKESNEEAQFASDEKNRTDEEIGQATISKFTQVLALNQKISSEAEQTRLNFEQELRDTKTYLAWNEARREEIERKRESLENNQCLSNQLFVRSIKQSQEALSAIALLKGDLQSYVATGSDVEFAQISSNEVKTVADKLRKYSSVFNTNEINTFLQLAESSSSSSSESEEEVSAPGKRRGTLPEQLLQVLNDLEERVEESLEHLKENEIAAAW
jgi:hypothetical protein